MHDRLGPPRGDEDYFDQEVDEELQGEADREQEQKPQMVPYRFVFQESEEKGSKDALPGNQS